MAKAQELSTEELEERLRVTCLRKLQGYFEDAVEADEAMMASKALNILVKQGGVRAHVESLKFSMIQTIFVNQPDQLSKALAMLRPELKRLSGV